MTKEQKEWIDNASLEDLLHKWRFTPLSANEPMFQGECGEYYKKVMFGKRDKNPEEWTRASKRIGWGD